MTDVAVGVTDVQVLFGGLRAVDGLTLRVHEGQRRAIIGPNGAGKTTLFTVIGGQRRPNTGSVHLFGQDVTRMAPPKRARMGLGRTFQITNLLQDLTVRENVMLGAVAVSGRARYQPWRALSSVSDVVDRTEALLSKWELTGQQDRLVKELAYGEQRILELAMAMSAEPKVLLLDEPTAGVSKGEAQLVVDVIAALPDDLTILLIEHDMEVAFALADQVTVMADGLELVTGTAEEIQGNPAVIEAYLGGSRHGAA